ncbi:MAG: hypothetical protein ACRDDY_06195 [Clostridium sp.]|uniref:hypothetical protein n=1 Tax=Clostridium sp. TaxID=1506 RepID=UPI003EE43B1E
MNNQHEKLYEIKLISVDSETGKTCEIIILDEYDWRDRYNVVDTRKCKKRL